MRLNRPTVTIGGTDQMASPAVVVASDVVLASGSVQLKGPKVSVDGDLEVKLTALAMDFKIRSGKTSKSVAGELARLQAEMDAIKQDVTAIKQHLGL